MRIRKLPLVLATFALVAVSAGPLSGTRQTAAPAAPLSVGVVLAADPTPTPEPTPTPTPTPSSAVFTYPSPGAETALPATAHAITWTESGPVTSRSLTEEYGLAASGTCAGVHWTTAWTVAVTGSPYAVSGFTQGFCYRYTLTLNDDSSTAAASGDLIVISPTAAADPSKLATSYVLTSRMSYTAGRVDTVETVTVTNKSGAYFRILNLSALPRALGYLTLTGSVKAGSTTLPAAWTNHTNLAVTLPPLAPGATTTITIPFRLVVGTSASAFGVRTSKAGGILNLGEWFPIVSKVHDAYGIGDPQVTWNASSITFDLTLTDGARVRNAVAASGDLVTAPATSGTHWRFVAKNVRDFAVSVSPSYHLYSGTVGSTTIKAYATTSAKGTALLSITKAAMAKYNAYYGAYPYKTFSIAQVGGSGFSMEFPTMVFMGADMVTNKYVIWHEVAHQWFYGMLGNDQLTSPWLDEGWAEFSARYFLGMSLGNCSTKDVNRTTTSWPAGLTTGSWFGCQGYFETIYHRGTTFINAIRLKMGTSAFFSAVRSYIALHRYGNVSELDFLKYLDAKTSANLWAGPIHTYTSFN